MTSLGSLLPYVQILLALLLTGAVLLQQSGAGLGGAFGDGANWSSAFHTRRGPEKFLFNATIILGILFAISAFISLIIR